jgi:hypothetical protein
MTKHELRELARVGYAAKLKQLEADLADGFKQFPELFLGTTPPQIMRPELRNGAGTHWPIEARKGKGKRQPLVNVTEQRTRTSNLLAAIGEFGKPMSSEEIVAAGFNLRSLPPLTRTGYLKRTKHGIVRTAKKFEIRKD